jgi:hypothetical protein
MQLRPSAVACVLAAALCPAPFVNAQTNDGAALTLDEALLLARSNNRDLKQFGLDVGKQRETLGEAKTHLYPRFDTFVLAAQLLTPIDFTIKKGQLGTFTGTGPIPGANTDLHTPARPIAIASVTATQPLTELIRIHLSIVDQRLKVDAAQLTFDQREQKLTDDVRQSYYQVPQAQIQYESQQSIVKYLEELLQLTDWRFSQRAVLEAERLSVKAEVAKATYQLTTIEDRLADSKDVLNHLLGRSVQTEFSVEPVPATLPEQEDLPAARATALEHRPEMKLAGNRVRQAELATKSEKTRYIPDVLQLCTASRRRTMTSRRDLLKGGAVVAMAEAVPASVVLADPMPERHEPTARTFWPDGARMVISVSTQMEAGAQPTSGAESPMPKIDPKYPDLPAGKWYDYGFKEGLPSLDSSTFLTVARSRSLPTWSVPQWTCTPRSQKRLFSVGTKQADTGKPGLHNSP